jgi:predicted ATPase with chaperone activity
MKDKDKSKKVKMRFAVAFEAVKTAQRERLSFDHQLMEEVVDRLYNLEDSINELDAVELPDEIMSLEVEVPTADKVPWSNIDAEEYLDPIIALVQEWQSGSGGHAESNLLDRLEDLLSSQTYISVMY